MPAISAPRTIHADFKFKFPLEAPLSLPTKNG